MAFRVIRTAKASWSGTVPEGGGRLALGSGAFEGPFTLRARVEDGQPGDESRGARRRRHAGCFTMSLANLLSEEGHPPDDLQTTARVALEQLETGFTITRIVLDTVGSVAGIDAATFVRLAEQAKATCPVSRALAGTEITLTARLESNQRGAS